ncbi:MAG: serine protease [Chloroflexi bacterium]|nr:serine protease [Chloroflexota bacterium]
MHHIRSTASVGILLVMLVSAAHVAADELPTPEPRIVGGVEAAPGEIPWQVAVYPAGYLCGGSLVDAGYVITAAHCVVNDAGAPISPSQITIVAGEYTRGASEGDEQTRSVSALYVHPSYEPDTYNNDIALLRLASPVTLNARVATIAPARDASLGDAGATALVSGWGTTSSGGDTAETLRKVTMPIVSNATCAGSYGSGSITANMLCAGLAAGGVDSCQGDSGGPLAVQRSGSWYLTGVVSWGTGCADPNYYGVYTRVSRFISWLDGYLPDATTPGLTVNYAAGAPCSSFLVEGSGYTAGATVQASINGMALGSAVVEGDGTLQLLLESDCAADAGGYRVSISDADSSATGRAATAAHAAYQLVTSGPNAVVRAAPAGAPAPVPVPASVVPLRVLYLPVVRR